MQPQQQQSNISTPLQINCFVIDREGKRENRNNNEYISIRISSSSSSSSISNSTVIRWKWRRIWLVMIMAYIDTGIVRIIFLMAERTTIMITRHDKRLCNVRVILILKLKLKLKLISLTRIIR